MLARFGGLRGSGEGWRRTVTFARASLFAGGVSRLWRGMANMKVEVPESKCSQRALTLPHQPQPPTPSIPTLFTQPPYSLNRTPYSLNLTPYSLKSSLHPQPSGSQRYSAQPPPPQTPMPPGSMIASRRSPWHTRCSWLPAGGTEVARMSTTRCNLGQASYPPRAPRFRVRQQRCMQPGALQLGPIIIIMCHNRKSFALKARGLCGTEEVAMTYAASTTPLVFKS